MTGSFVYGYVLLLSESILLYESFGFERLIRHLSKSSIKPSDCEITLQSIPENNPYWTMRVKCLGQGNNGSL